MWGGVMPFCSQCGAQNAEKAKFCQQCGKKVLAEKPQVKVFGKEFKVKRSMLMLTIVSAVILIVIVALIFFARPGNVAGGTVDSKSLGEKSTSPQPEQKRVDCPHECCVNSEYNDKLCGEGFECLQYSCKMIDSDGDGLGDIEEQRLGTNPRLSDTDSDGLTDYIEVKEKGSNPLLANTDGDRYNDGVDPSPLKPNSAVLSLAIERREKEIDVMTVTEIATPIATFATVTGLTGGATASAWPILLAVLNSLKVLDKPLYTNHVTVSVRNVGDDYTAWFEYKIKVYSGNDLIKTVPSGRKQVRVDASQTYSDSMDFDILVKDVVLEKAPNIIKDFKNLHFDYRVEEANYEIFR
jgi:ribosomal protein L40E